MNTKLQTVFSKFFAVMLIVVLFCVVNAGQAHSALRNLETEFKQAVRMLDVEKINSLLKEGFHADDGVSSFIGMIPAVSMIVRGTSEVKMRLN